MNGQRRIIQRTGRGRTSEDSRRQAQAISSYFPVGKGVSHGPLGTSIRTSQQAPTAQQTVTAYYA